MDADDHPDDDFRADDFRADDPLADGAPAVRTAPEPEPLAAEPAVTDTDDTPADTPDPDPVPVFDDVLAPDAVAAFVARSQRRGSASAFQALLAAAEATVRRALAPLGAASDAALSLAQQTTVDAAAAHLAAGADALHAGLSAEGRALTEPSSGAASRLLDDWVRRLRDGAARLTSSSEAPRGPSWVAALAAAVDALAAAADHLDTLALGQPADSSARALGLGVARQLRRHRDALVEDAARMME